MQAGNRIIPWWTWSVGVAVAALSWPTVRAVPDDAVPRPPPAVRETNAGPAAGGDQWRPRGKTPPPVSPAAPPPAAAGDGWRPRIRSDPAVVPAMHSQRPGAKADEPGSEEIRTLPTPLGEAPKSKEQVVEDRAVLLSAARNAVRQGNYELALSRYEEFLRRYGDDAAVLREYAGVLFSANRLEQATRQYQRLVDAQPDNLTLRMTLGDIYLANQDYRKAAAEFVRVLKQAPANLEAAARLARAYALDKEDRKSVV